MHETSEQGELRRERSSAYYIEYKLQVCHSRSKETINGYIEIITMSVTLNSLHPLKEESQKNALDLPLFPFFPFLYRETKLIGQQ